MTTGKAPKSKRDRKPEGAQQQQPKHLHPLLYAGMAPPSAGEMAMMMHAPPPLYGDPSLQHLHYMQQLYAGMPPHFGHFQHPSSSASQHHAVMDPARQLLNATYHSSGGGDQMRPQFFQPQLPLTQQFHQPQQRAPAPSSSLKRPLSRGEDSDSEEDSGSDEEEEKADERKKRGGAVEDSGDGSCKRKKAKDTEK